MSLDNKDPDERTYEGGELLTPKQRRNRYLFAGLALVGLALFMGKEGLEAMRTGAVVHFRVGDIDHYGWEEVGLSGLALLLGLFSLGSAFGFLKPRK